MNTPGSPLRSIPGKATTERDRILNDLSARWGLIIRPPEDGESPKKRLEKLAAGRNAETHPEECFFKINYLCLKDRAALSTALNAFNFAAITLQSGWIYKPSADDDLLPRSTRSRSVLAAAQREQLFQCLLHFLTPVFDQVKERHVKSPATQGKKNTLSEISLLGFTPQVVFERHVVDEQLDDTPIPFRLEAKGRGKRRSDGDDKLKEASKRTKGLLDDSASQKVIDVVDGVNVITRQRGLNQSNVTQPTTISGVHTLPATSAFKIPEIPGNVTRSIRDQRHQGKQSETANTSFTSNASVLSSIFDDDKSDGSDETFFSTQTSLMDMSQSRGGTQENEPQNDKEYTQYGSSIGDFEIIDFQGFTPEDTIRDRLRNVFPVLPEFLQDSPLAVRYEITRVCSNAKVSVADLYFPIANFSMLHDYDSLWSLLKAQPALKGKEFPERSNRDAWISSLGTFHKGFHGVILSAKLKFSTSLEGPFFSVQLQPLKFELSHRLSRRFGNDRFLEISVPSLSGTKVPKLLKDAMQSGHGEACRRVIAKWISREQHNFLGIKWGGFYLKDNSTKRPRLKLSVDKELDNHPAYTAYLFATDGVGFRASKTIPQKGEPPHRHTKMDVGSMVNWLIPLQTNQQQKCLKLFSRIALGLSKTWKTVVLEPSEIRYVPDLLSENNIEVMNDGCGRMSLQMALNIVECLGLSHVPGGFQARIGGAKGLWIIDVNDNNEQQWIEIYPSQLKWDRFSEVTDLANHEMDHRTFEVVDYVKPLKPAALNLQLIPLLEDRGKNRASMREAISSLLVNGLKHEIQMQRAAMESPQTLRKWVRDNNSGVEERIKHGQVPYIAGLPRSTEEQLNLLLDAGFDPQRLQFVKDLAWKIYSQRCDILMKKLKIAVGLSTNAYIAVDFTGVLEADEVYLSFSKNFTCEISGFSEPMLDGMDILVARNPAHYISDIQKVKAVWRRELKSLKDVIVFSSKGNFPLAKTLSGGDYDGDTAWICWEPSIVSEFENANIPICPDLVSLNYIRKDKTSYSDIIAGHADPIPEFLEYCFEFNLRDNLLGYCTNHKERLCYTTNTVSDPIAILLSTLVSELVDQRKQGYSFTLESWERMKRERIGIAVRIPHYKHDRFIGSGQPEHIVDYLKFVIAERTVEDTKTDFYNSLAPAEQSDIDVVKLANWARDQAKSSPDWRILLEKLEHDIELVKKTWNQRFHGQAGEESLANFAAVATDVHHQWQSISPPSENQLSQALAPSCLPSKEFSTFSLLKASLGFLLSVRGRLGGNFIWWMAGKQLAALKTIYGNDGSGGAVIVTPQMYAMLRPDSTFVKLMQSRTHDPRFWEAKAESVVPEEESDGEEWGEEMDE